MRHHFTDNYSLGGKPRHQYMKNISLEGENMEKKIVNWRSSNKIIWDNKTWIIFPCRKKLIEGLDSKQNVVHMENYYLWEQYMDNLSL